MEADVTLTGEIEAKRKGKFWCKNHRGENKTCNYVDLSAVLTRHLQGGKHKNSSSGILKRRMRPERHFW